MNDSAFIDSIIAKGKQASEKVIAEFDSLGIEQLNWKPSAEKWSIAQCLHHLITADSTYFPALKEIAEGRYQKTGWQRNSPFTRFWGWVMVNQLGETPKRKMKAPKIFRPSSSKIEDDIILNYNTQLDQLLKLIEDCKNIDLDKTIIYSPVTKFITYSLRKTFQLLMQHEHRHINQGIKLKKLENFPG